MPRFNFTNITAQSKVNISDIMGNFDKIEQNGITEAEVNTKISNVNTTINNMNTNLSKVATTTANGLMSSADKSKLNGIAANANNYSLPTASSTLGGVKTTSNVSDSTGYTPSPIINGVPYYKDTNTTYSNATINLDGLMSSTDKAKLNSISFGANAYILPTAGRNSLGGVKTTSNISDASGYIPVPIINGIPYYKDTNTTYSNATTSSNGLMTKEMVSKLNGIASGATAVGIINNLTSDKTDFALSAYQGKILNDTKQKNISRGTGAPSGGSNGDIYIQYFN